MTARADYIAVKFFGPTDRKGSRYKIVNVWTDKARWVEVDHAFRDSTDQLEAEGYSYLFQHNGWTYFSLVEGR